MKNNELKESWSKLYTDNNIYSTNIKEIIRMKHSQIISKTLCRKRRNIGLFIFSLVIAFIFAIWDMLIMGTGSIPLWTAVAFLLFNLISSINSYRILISSADFLSIKESTAIMKKRLERTVRLDFIIYLVFFYGIAIQFVIRYLNEHEALAEFKYLLICFLLILLTIPWFMRYQNKQQYKHYLNSLEKNITLMEE